VSGDSSSTAEIGMGIHNEPGAQSLSTPIPPLSELSSTMVDMLLSTPASDPERGYLPVSLDGKDEAVLLVNNLGGVGGLEMDAVTRTAMVELKRRGVLVKRVCVGTYMVSAPTCFFGCK
jgi:dihydroxyacetone kinase